MDELTGLEAEYCPPIDPALLIAIVSDYDLNTASGLSTARETLDQLKECATVEEAAGFDPSGLSAQHVQRQHSDEAQSATDDASLSNDLTSLSLNGTETTDSTLESLDEDTKLLLLYDIFGEQVSEQTLRSSLQSANGNWHLAMEELLNQVYFNDTDHGDTGEKAVAKGIDGFAEDQVSRKTRRRRNRTRRTSESTDSSASESLAPSAWQAAKADVDFLSARTGLAAATVRLTYNQQGASVPRTINAILKDEMKAHTGADEEPTTNLAAELGKDFPTIAAPYLSSLIRISHPSSSHAHELAKALVARPAGSGRIIPQYARPTDADIEGTSWQKVTKKQSWTTIPSVLGEASYAAARAQAFAQANAAHRKAKSDRLMGGAAAYYSQLGRDYNSMTHSATAAAADALANSQSSATQVDLHGVDVLNGVRIACEKVEQWYRALGENLVNGRVGASQRNEDFRIIVGLGKHSEGGKGKLGPAVMKMLGAEGWRFVNEGAVISVKGKQKH